MGISLLLLHVKLFWEFLINLGSSILFLPNPMAFFLKDVQLLPQIGQLLIQIKFSLIVEHLIGLVPSLHTDQHFFLSRGHFQQRFFFLQLLLQISGLGFCLIYLPLVFATEDIQLANLFLYQAGSTFSRSIFSSRATRYFFISS